MSKNRWVNTRFWSDNYIIDLDPSEKLLFLYCITNDHTSLCGAYEISLRTICLETGFDKDMVLKILARFERDGKVRYVDGYVVVRNYRKYQADNLSIKAGIEREESTLPQHIKDSLYTAWVQPAPSVPPACTQDPNTLPIPKLIPTPIPNGRDGAEAPKLKLPPNEVYLYWEEQIAPITRYQETQRKASVTLFNSYGLDKCRWAIRVLVHAHANQYARKEVKCQSLGSLLANWDKVVIYAKGINSQRQQQQSKLENIV